MQLFADSQTHFAAVSEDGRLKIWDVAAGTVSQELQERDHLSYRYTSAAWTQPVPQSKKRGSDSALGLLALGTSDGHVVIWDLVKGEVKRTLSEASRGPVTALAFNVQGSLLYSGSGAKHVLEWSVSSGELVRKFRCGSGGASALAVSPDGAVLAMGGSSLRTFDLSSGKKSRKLGSGVSSAVTQLRFAAAEDGIEASRFLFAATAGARFVNVYDLELTEHDAPALTLSLPSSAEGIFARASVGEAVVAKKKKSKKSKKDAEPVKPAVDLFIGATTPAGSLFLWAHKYQQVSDVAELALASKPLPPTISSAESAGILLAELSKAEDSDKTEILVARGSLVKPVFETVSPVEESAPGQWKEELEFEEISDALLLSAERADADSKNGTKRQKVETSAEDEKTHIPTLSDRRGLANSLAVADETTSFEELNNAEDEEESELTLAERVEALREHVENDVTVALSRAEHEANDKPRGTKPDAASLASVLEQALQARDNAMLEYCLRIHDLKTVRRTVSRISSFRVLPLLETIVRKMERTPSRCARLCPWLRSVLLYHTAYLVAQPDLVPSLSALYQLLETRLQAHEQLQRLAGRLTLVLGQIHVNTHKDDEEDEKPAVVYNEGEEEAAGTEGGDSNNEEDEDEEEEEEDAETEEE